MSRFSCTNHALKKTPLYFAVYFKRIELVKYLLSKGANVNAKEVPFHSCMIQLFLTHESAPFLHFFKSTLFFSPYIFFRTLTFSQNKGVAYIALAN